MHLGGLLFGVLLKQLRSVCTLYGCVVTWGEVLYITQRAYGPEKAEEVEAIMEELPIEWVDADRELT